MNKVLEEKLRAIMDDDLLITAIRTVFEERISKEMPDKDCPNSELGEKYRAYLVGKDFIDKAFKDLSNYKVDVTPKKNFNKER